MEVIPYRMFHVLDLQKIMAESRDYDELLFAWKGWRDSAGKVIRDDYMRYVELANKAATLNGTRLGAVDVGKRSGFSIWLSFFQI